MFKKKETNLFKRVKKLFRNIQCICKTGYVCKDIKIIETNDYYYYWFSFNSTLGKVEITLSDRTWNNKEQYTLNYWGVNNKGIKIEVEKDSTIVTPAIRKDSIMKAEEISLAIYELEKVYRRK